jgi:hypothetical protein
VSGRVDWCGRGDSNPHALAGASPSSVSGVKPGESSWDSPGLFVPAGDTRPLQNPPGPAIVAQEVAHGGASQGGLASAAAIRRDFLWRIDRQPGHQPRRAGERSGRWPESAPGTEKACNGCATGVVSVYQPGAEFPWPHGLRPRYDEACSRGPASWERTARSQCLPRGRHESQPGAPDHR